MLNHLQTHNQLLARILRRLEKNLRPYHEKDTRIYRDIMQVQKLIEHSSRIVEILKNEQDMVLTVPGYNQPEG